MRILNVSEFSLRGKGWVPKSGFGTTWTHRDHEELEICVRADDREHAELYFNNTSCTPGETHIVLTVLGIAFDEYEVDKY